MILGREAKIESFFKKYFNQNKEIVKISLGTLRILKKDSIATEQFLDYLCQEKGLLLHGSIYWVKNGKLISENNGIFATNKAAIVIMRSLYSNEGVNLQYPYFISDKNPLKLGIHTRADGKFTKKNTGFVYILNGDGFKNEPKGSWQFLKETDKVDFIAVVETESNDFTYPVRVFDDFN